MAKKNNCWGIEVGANAIKAMHLGRSGDEVRVLDYVILPFKKILTTPDLNVNETIQVGLEQLLAERDVNRATVVISVPGHLALARFTKLPPVEAKKIPDIVEFEAIQQIPFPIDQVEWDYQIFQQEDSPDVQVGIFAITKERVTKFLGNYHELGLRVDGLTLSPLAVFNAFAFDLEFDSNSPGTVILDIGSTSTDVVAYESDQVWLRTLPIGGNNFTDALVRAFKLSSHKAEKFKKEASTSKYTRQILQAMRPAFDDFSQEVKRSLGYYQSFKHNAELKRLIVIGSTCRLPGLVKYLKQQLQMDVIRLDGFKRLKVEAKRKSNFSNHALNLATAYGLALQGLDLETVHANILPRQIIHKRLWKAKQPMFAVAAALVALAVTAAGTSLWMRISSHEKTIEQNNKQINAVIANAKTLKGKLDEISAGEDPRKAMENLRRILDYRDVWPKLMEDLHRAANALTPQPALLTANYDDIAKIGRPQRRRLYIESITAEYLYTNAGSTDEDQGVTAAQPALNSFTAEDYWGTKLEQSDEEEEDNESQEDENFGDPTFPSPKPPRFVIILEGTMPYSGGARFISETFIKWLQEHANQANRPYQYVVTRDALFRSHRIGSELDARKNEHSTMSPYTSLRTTRAGAHSVLSPLAGQQSSFSLSPTADGGMGKGDQLLPIHPLSEEDRSADLRFAIRWTVELRSPEQARKAESGRAGSDHKQPTERDDVTASTSDVTAASQEDQL